MSWMSRNEYISMKMYILFHNKNSLTRGVYSFVRRNLLAKITSFAIRFICVFLSLHTFCKMINSRAWVINSRKNMSERTKLSKIRRSLLIIKSSLKSEVNKKIRSYGTQTFCFYFVFILFLFSRPLTFQRLINISAAILIPKPENSLNLTHCPLIPSPGWLSCLRPPCPALRGAVRV